VRRLWPRLVIVLAILCSAHYYVWTRLIAAAELPAPWHAIATIAFVILAPSLPATAIATRRLPRTTAMPFAITAYTWFALATYLLLAAAIGNIATALGVIAPRTAAIGGVLAAVLAVAYGFVNVRRGPIVRRTKIALPRLPASASGYTIAQLTDVHIGPTLGRAFAERIVREVNALAPDLIVITGDLVDGRLDELADHVAPLAQLRAKDGVYAVTGNHEYYWNAEAWMAHIASLGVTRLRNAHVVIRDAFTLAGVDDSTFGEDVSAALAGRDHALPTVLLAHHPSTIRRSQDHVDLQLSGHTHGGQLLPLGYLARLFEPALAGLARFGSTQLYISEGTGYWGPPVRVGTSCEIALITLVQR